MRTAVRSLVMGAPPKFASALVFTGATGNFLSTPDSASLAVAGDLDVRAKAALTSWSPASVRDFFGQYGVSGQRSFSLRIAAGGLLSLRWSPDGSTALSATATAATGLVDGATSWVRATLDVDDGAGNRVVRFYRSSDGTAWTQIGDPVTTAGVTSVSSAPTIAFELGSSAGGASPLSGSLIAALVLDGIDGPPVIDFAATRVRRVGPQSPSVVTQVGRTWTGNGSAWSWAA